MSLERLRAGCGGDGTPGRVPILAGCAIPSAGLRVRRWAGGLEPPRKARCPSFLLLPYLLGECFKGRGFAFAAYTTPGSKAKVLGVVLSPRLLREARTLFAPQDIPQKYTTASSLRCRQERFTRFKQPSIRLSRKADLTCQPCGPAARLRCG